MTLGEKRVLKASKLTATICEVRQMNLMYGQTVDQVRVKVWRAESDWLSESDLMQVSEPEGGCARAS